jgi:hypothetical protein
VDVFTERKSLERRRALLDAMQQQNMQSPIVGNTGVGPLLAKLGTSYFNMKGAENLDQAASDNQTRYGSELGGAMEEYLRKSRGAPGDVLTDKGADQLLNQNMDAGAALREPQKPDPQAAVLQAMTSRFPELQQIGMAQLKNQPDPESFGQPQTVIDPATGRPMLSQYGNRGTARPVQGALPFEKPMTVGDKVVDTFDPNKILANHGANWGAPFKREGDWYQKDLGTGKEVKLDNAPKVSTTVNVPKGESAFDKTFGEKEAGRLSEALENRPMLIEGVAAAQKGTQLLDQGIYTGAFGDIETGLAKVGAEIGMVDPAKASRTEIFKSYIADIVIPRLKDFGGSDTVEELKYLQDANAGRITAEEQTLRNVLRSVEEKMSRKLSAVDEVAKRRNVQPGMSTLATVSPTPLPTTPPGAAAVPIPLSDYLKQKRAKPGAR